MSEPEVKATNDPEVKPAAEPAPEKSALPGSKDFSMRGILLVLAITLFAGFLISVIYHSIVELSYNKGRQSVPALGDVKGSDSQPRLQAFNYVDLELLEDSVHLRTATKAMVACDYQDALNELDHVSMEGRNRDQTWFTLQVECLLSTRSIDKVYGLAEDYMKRHPEDYAGPMWLAQAYEADKKYQPAIAGCQKAFVLFQRQKDDIEKKYNPIYAQKMIEAVNGLILRRTGACYERMENYKDACTAFERAFLVMTNRKMEPTLPLPDRPFAAGKNLPSLAELNQFIAQRPKDSHLYLQRAMIEKALGKYDAALADCNEAEKLTKSDSNRVYYQRAGVYYGMKDYKSAARDLRRVFAEDPLYEKPQARQKRYAFVMMPVANMRKSQVLKRFDQMILEKPDTAINYFNRGTLQLGFHDYELAAQDLLEYFSLTKNEAGETGIKANVFLALCRSFERRTNEATAILEKAEEQSRNHPWWHTVVQYLQGKMDDDALTQSAGDNQSRIVQAHYFMGQKLALQGKMELADKQWKAGVERGAPVIDEYYLCKLAQVPELKSIESAP